MITFQYEIWNVRTWMWPGEPNNVLGSWWVYVQISGPQQSYPPTSSPQNDQVQTKELTFIKRGWNGGFGEMKVQILLTIKKPYDKKISSSRIHSDMTRQNILLVIFTTSRTCRFIQGTFQNYKMKLGIRRSGNITWRAVGRSLQNTAKDGKVTNGEHNLTGWHNFTNGH